jgi:hypothetical protein
MSDAKEIFDVYVEMKQEPEMHMDRHGNKMWYVNGKLHRDDAPAIEWRNGATEWYQHGKRHRIGAPAIEFTNGKEWWMNNKLHREDGPAIDYAPNENNASGIKKWYLNGHQYNDIAAWAKALLKYNKMKPTQDAVDAKVAEVMQADLFN